MDPLVTAFLATNPPTWALVAFAALYFAFLGWRAWLAAKSHVVTTNAHARQVELITAAQREVAASAPGAEMPPPPAAPGIKPGTGIGPALVLLALIGLSVLRGVAVARLAQAKAECGPCPSPGICTPQGCRGVALPPPPPPQNAQTLSLPRHGALDAPWPAAFPWRGGSALVSQ